MDCPKHFSPLITGALLAVSLAVCSATSAEPGLSNEPLALQLERSENPAVRPSPRVPVNQAWLDAYEKKEKILNTNAGTFDYFIVGDSITAGWTRTREAKEQLDLLFGNGNVMNLGQPADKTEHIIWRLLHHTMGQANPKVAMVLAGTNNSNDDEYSVEEIAGGVEAIIRILQAKLPQTKILLLGIFPRGSSEQRMEIKNGLTEAGMNPQWEKIEKVNQIIETFADGENIVYLNINQSFLNENGALPVSVMPDLLHPNAKGYEIWANTVKSTLTKMQSKSTE